MFKWKSNPAGKVLALFIFFYALSFAQSVGPRVTVPQLTYEFYDLAKGAKLDHAFMIYNGGGAVLKLYGVSTSCKCITASLDKTTLQPADSAKLSVEYTNTGTPTSLENYISIKTNDPDNPDVRIFLNRVVPPTGPTLSQMPNDTVGGKGAAPIIYFPETEHNFGQMKQGTIDSYTFKFMNKGNSNLRIRDITTSCGCTAALIKEKDIAPGKEGEILVQFDSSGKLGKLVRRVTVLSNDPKDTYKALLIYADVTKE